jgi:uncharacterized protein (DUF433 family)
MGWQVEIRIPFSTLLAAGDTPGTILAGYPWLQPEDIQACLAYAHRLVAHERIEPLVTSDAK